MLIQVTVLRSCVAFELGGRANQLDPMMHKTVEIIKGPNKGYRGEVRAVGHGVYILVIEASHQWKTVPMDYARYVGHRITRTYLTSLLF